VTSGATSTPKTTRRAWRFVTPIIVVALVLGGLFAADAAARAYAGAQLKDQLVSAIGLPASTVVSVDFGPSPILLQALSGSLSSVAVHVPKLAFGTLVGDADILATSVPLDTSKPIGTLTVSYAVTEKNLQALAGNLAGTQLESIAVQNQEVMVTTSLSVLGARVPVGIGLTPSVSQGKLVFTPTTVDVAGQKLTAQQLIASPVFGPLASALLTQQSFCIAQYLPVALTASSAKVVDSSLVLTFTAHDAVLGGAGFSTKGSCS
jgi:hypothetical protein